MVARIVSSRTDAEVALADRFGATKAMLPGTGAVAQMRDSAFGAFAASGLPHRRVEAWHYTDLRNLMNEAFPTAAAPTGADIEAVRSELATDEPLPGTRLVIVDGIYVPALSDAPPAGVSVRSLAEILVEGRPEIIQKLAGHGLGSDDAIVALNAALMQDGVVVEVAAGARVAEPIRLLYATASKTPVARFPRSLVTIEGGAVVHVAESSLGAGGRTGQTFGCLIFDVADEANVSHTSAMTRTVLGSQRVDTFMAQIGARATFNSFALVTGEGLMRRQLFMRLAGDDTKAALRGVSLLRGRDHADTTLDVEHVGLGCEGRESFRYILDDASTGVFQGRIRVAPGAQKTDGKMMSRALLLSDDAAMYNKPELEIFADDVACGHGATCGGLNEDQLFYLQARGIARVEAESLLLEAFAAEMADDIGQDAIGAGMRGEIVHWLKTRNRG